MCCYTCLYGHLCRSFATAANQQNNSSGTCPVSRPLESRVASDIQQTIFLASGPGTSFSTAEPWMSGDGGDFPNLCLASALPILIGLPAWRPVSPVCPSDLINTMTSSISITFSNSHSRHPLPPQHLPPFQHELAAPPSSINSSTQLPHPFNAALPAPCMTSLLSQARCTRCPQPESKARINGGSRSPFRSKWLPPSLECQGGIRLGPCSCCLCHQGSIRPDSTKFPHQASPAAAHRQRVRGCVHSCPLSLLGDLLPLDHHHYCKSP